MFIFTAGKDDAELEFKDLQIYSHVVAKLSKHFHNKGGHKLYFDNWFTTTIATFFETQASLCCWHY